MYLCRCDYNHRLENRDIYFSIVVSRGCINKVSKTYPLVLSLDDIEYVPGPGVIEFLLEVTKKEWENKIAGDFVIQLFS